MGLLEVGVTGDVALGRRLNLDGTFFYTEMRSDEGYGGFFQTSIFTLGQRMVYSVAKSLELGLWVEHLDLEVRTDVPSTVGRVLERSWPGGSESGRRVYDGQKHGSKELVEAGHFEND